MSGWPDGYGRRIMASVDSTLSEAARIAPEIAGPEWILAHTQTAARGRRGRAWSAPTGNFSATLVLPVAEPAQHAALRSFVASLALYDAFVAVSGQSTAFALKWPNDVLLRGGKVAGILLESAGQGHVLSHLAIGIGVNLAAAPSVQDVEAGAVPPVALRTTLGIDVTPEAFLDALAVAYANYETQFRDFGFAPIRTAWMQKAARLNEMIRARTAREEWHGIFREVDADGQLVLETAKGRISVPAADVYF
ncbi:biotin--[acetyl-CoA-carboxylase] ligase [Ascidiaceihabitans sp.]|uniref:biotin--[acetyl-CoA-carboxylase] ligase n=1 Tax=Ascidiaceihabitans sp. TaxID=1872644 RepID=UPI00329913F8